MAADRIAALIVCLIVGAVAVAGCGSGEERSDKDYVAELQDVATSFGAGANKLSKQISELGPLTLKSAGALLQTFSDQVDELAAEIDDVDPPAAVEQLHARLLALLESFGSKAQQAAIAL
ncbi:MAG: hypothetical protein M3O25_10645, partial [Actinomycetota bacterium]|nr:hypothetical protein [Actinomycetota bacterium]